MTGTIRLRPWQRAALEKFLASESGDFLAVATPGAGKTTFALTCARTIVAQRACRLVIVAPTAHLKLQWAAAATRFGIHLDHEWAPGEGRLPPDMHGIVTTFQQVATGTTAKALATLAADAFVVFDEVHHAGDDKAWGTSIRTAFDRAHRRLGISGTPFRSDTQSIPFVRYVLDEAVSDYEYGYADALRDGAVVRPVYFPRVDGLMEWTAPDGSVVAATFQDGLAAQQAAQRLRTALSLEGDWIPEALRAAHERLERIRVDQPDAAGLVIATDQEHARGIARLMRNRLGTDADVVTSDDPDASSRISAFTHSARPWIIAVRMVSEGVDIPRLRVGVFATTTATELFFRQAVGRLVRWQAPASGAPASQKAFFFIPDDPRLRHHAFQIADQRRHCLRKPSDDEEVVDGIALSPEDAAPLDGLGDPEQLSLFTVISAVATEINVHASTTFVAGIDDEPDPVDPHLEDDPSLVFELAPLPILSAAGDAIAHGAGGGVTLKQRKIELRDANAELARLLVNRTGMSHAKVNLEMNRLAGVVAVGEATLEQLQRRLDRARAWYDKAGLRSGQR